MARRFARVENLHLIEGHPLKTREPGITPQSLLDEFGVHGLKIRQHKKLSNRRVVADVAWQVGIGGFPILRPHSE